MTTTAKIVLITGLLAAAGFVLLSTKQAYADDSSTLPPFAQRLVERFNLNEDEVTTFFDEQKTERQGIMQQSREERLNQAVSDGVITEEQKQALLAKWQETLQEREQHKEEMHVWMEEQGIDPEALREHGGLGHKGLGHGFRVGYKFGSN